MIPLLAVMHVRGVTRRPIRLWLPLAAVWLLLLPFALVLLPAIWIAMLAARIHPVRAIGAFWSVLAGTRGAHAELTHRNHSVLIHII